MAILRCTNKITGSHRFHGSPLFEGKPVLKLSSGALLPVPRLRIIAPSITDNA